MSDLPPITMGAAWMDRRRELASWTWQRLVNRHDVYGYYTTDGPFTGPHVADRGKVFLTPAQLSWHFAAAGIGDVLGLHSTSPDNTCIAPALDIDAHAGGNSPAACLRAAYAWYDDLREWGFNPLLAASNAPPGEGGFHLRLLLRSPASSAAVYAFLQALGADHARHGLASAPETFPKQAKLAAPGQRGQFGNWLRLPGRHHKRPYWSQVYDSERWLDGAEAVAFLLTLQGDDPQLIPPAPQPPVRRQWTRLHATTRGWATRWIESYMIKLPTGLGVGNGRDDVAFRFGAFLLHDVRLPRDLALGWLEEWDAKQSVPKGKERLGVILGNAMTYGRGATT